MLGRMLRLLGTLALAAILVLSLLTGELQVKTIVPEVLEHFIAYAMAAAVLGLAYQAPSERLVILFGLMAAAFGLELVQWPLPGRDSSIADWILSSAGACFGIGAIRVGEWLLGRSAQA